MLGRGTTPRRIGLLKEQVLSVHLCVGSGGGLRLLSVHPKPCSCWTTLPGLKSSLKRDVGDLSKSAHVRRKQAAWDIMKSGMFSLRTLKDQCFSAFG